VAVLLREARHLLLLLQRRLRSAGEGGAGGDPLADQLALAGRPPTPPRRRHLVLLDALYEGAVPGVPGGQRPAAGAAADQGETAAHVQAAAQLVLAVTLQAARLQDWQDVRLEQHRVGGANGKGRKAGRQEDAQEQSRMHERESRQEEGGPSRL